MKTALLLSAGGMFGAYQAGVWKTLEPVFQPDVVVGASIGALNGWAIAGGCSADRLIDLWLNLDSLRRYRWRVPRGFTDGFLDSTAVAREIQAIHGRFLPRVDYGVVVTETFRLRSALHRMPGITWEHLAASAAMLGFFENRTVGGRSCSDGGLLDSMPLWAATAMGAERVVAVNVLPELPSLVVRATVGAIRAVARYCPEYPDPGEVIRIDAPMGLGSAKDALYWKRDNVERWIARGEADARAAVESICSYAR